MKHAAVFLFSAVSFFFLLMPLPPAAAQTNISAQQIADAVQQELQADPAIRANRIEVRAENGVVTLSGTVRNLLAKDRAGRTAATVRGVQVVLNQVQVRPKKIPADADLLKTAMQALRNNPATEAAEINVKAENGMVTLSGKVDSFQERRTAEMAVAGINGVHEVVNLIDVVYVGRRPDAEIAADIRQALRSDVRLGKTKIDVQVNQGKVSLIGEVGSLAEKNLAAYDAYVLGALTVDDSGLKVNPDRRDLNVALISLPAAEVENALKSALVQNPWIDANHVNVEFKDETATLRGTVTTLAGKLEAEEEARFTIGIGRVNNLLKVRPGRELGDEEMETNIRQALLANPWLEKEELYVTAGEGTAYLAGSVDTFFEKNEAGRIAANTIGVEEIVNNIQVDGTVISYSYDPFVDEHIFVEEFVGVAPAFTVKSDGEITSDINEQLFWSPFVDANEVQVSVQNGVATLTGKVDSWVERNAAVENAIEGGAAMVSDKLVVER